LRRITDLQNLRQPLGPRSLQRRVRSRMMKIVRGPDCVLLALFARTAVATAGTAGL
jgi:hypothetical protein